jgi:hypothetical protein
MFYSQAQYDEAQRDLLGDGYSNEFQRCYEQSRLERPLRNQRAEAAALTALGRHVVCAQYEVTCPVTDGLIGYDFIIIMICKSRHQAEILTSSSDEVFIFEPEPAPAPRTPTEDDDIPF